MLADLLRQSFRAPQASTSPKPHGPRPRPSTSPPNSEISSPSTPPRSPSASPRGPDGPPAERQHGEPSATEQINRPAARPETTTHKPERRSGDLSPSAARWHHGVGNNRLAQVRRNGDRPPLRNGAGCGGGGSGGCDGEHGWGYGDVSSTGEPTESDQGSDGCGDDSEHSEGFLDADRISECSPDRCEECL
jgi:hypothetical protein